MHTYSRRHFYAASPPPSVTLPHLSTLHRNQVEREERRALGQAGINIQDRVFTSEEVREGEVREGEVREGKGGREQGCILGRSNAQDKLLCKHTNLDRRSQRFSILNVCPSLTKFLTEFL